MANCRFGFYSLSLLGWQNLLYQSLLVFRNQLARDGQIAPFLVCSNGLLADLARARYCTLYAHTYP